MSLKNYKIHRDLDKGEFLKAFGYTIVLAIFFGMVLIYICQCILKVRIENEVDDLIQSRAKLIQTNHRLRLERGFLKSFSRIDKEARERLGLTDPEEDQMIVLAPVFETMKEDYSDD
ncbi:MAG: cell division protein FtsL [bacterium]